VATIKEGSNDAMKVEELETIGVLGFARPSQLATIGSNLLYQ